MKSLLTFSLLTILATSLIAAEFDINQNFKGKTIKIDGNNFAMMNLLSFQLTKLKITHFSDESIVSSMKSIEQAQAGLSNKIEVGNMIVGNFTVKIQGKKPLILKIINNETAEVQSVQFFDEAAFQNAINSSGNKNGSSNIKCPGINNCFQKRPICKINPGSRKSYNSYYGREVFHGDFEVNYGSKIVFETYDFDTALSRLKEHADLKICDLEDYQVLACSVHYSKGSYYVLFGETRLIGETSSVKKATELKNKMIENKICYDLNGPISANQKLKEVLQASAQIPDYLTPPQDRSPAAATEPKNVFDEIRRFIEIQNVPTQEIKIQDPKPLHEKTRDA